jgi:hypothetical protein
VDVEDHVSETELVEPLEHCVDGRAFLGDEQHLLAARQEARDEVPDGLALARAGRSLDDQVLAREDAVDCFLLARVRVEDEVFVGR